MAQQLQRIPSSQPECSMEARMLAERLTKVQIGEVIPYVWLSKLIGHDVQRKRKDLLRTAKRLVQREYGIVFAPVTNVGLKRLDDLGILAVGGSDLQKMARATHRTGGKLACVDTQALSETDKQRLWAYQGILGAVAVLTHPKTLTQARTMTQPQQLAWDGSAVSQLFVAPQPQRQAQGETR